MTHQKYLIVSQGRIEVMSGRLLVLRSQNRTIKNQQLMEKVQNLVLDVNDRIIDELHDGDIRISKVVQHINKNSTQSEGFSKSKSMAHLQFPVPSYKMEDQIMTKQMIRRQREYQEHLENNAKQLQEKVRMEQQLLKENIELERKRKFQQNKLKAKHGIEQIKERHQNRIKKNVQQNAQLSSIKSEKKLHEILMQKWSKIEQQQKEQKIRIKQKLMQQKRINFDEIKQHAVRHDQTMTKFRQSRIAISRVSQPEPKKFYESTFMSRIVEENQQARQEYERKLNFGKQMAEKKMQYARIVRQNYRPSIRQSSKQESPPPLKVSKSLSNIQIIERGNDYMKQINSKLNRKSLAESKFTSQGNIKKSLFKYKNYLTEIRVKKDQQQKQMKFNERISSQKSYQKQIRKVMNQTDLKEHEKFMQAKLITKRMESQINKKNPFKLIDSIHAKIEILKHVSS